MAGQWDKTFNAIATGENCPNCGSQWTEDAAYGSQIRLRLGLVRIPVTTLRRREGISCSNCRYLGAK